MVNKPRDAKRNAEALRRMRNGEPVAEVAESMGMPLRTAYSIREKELQRLPLLDRKRTLQELTLMLDNANTFRKRLEVLQVIARTLPKEAHIDATVAVAAYADADAVLRAFEPSP